MICWRLGYDCWRTFRPRCWPTCGRPRVRSDSRPSRLIRSDKITEFSGDEIAWTLHWSRSYAFSQVLLGQALLCRLPMVFAALLAGRIDAAKANAFADALSGLDDETARAVATRLLVKAGESTLTLLREKLRYHVDRAVPAAATRRLVDSLANSLGLTLSSRQRMRAHTPLSGPTLGTEYGSPEEYFARA